MEIAATGLSGPSAVTSSTIAGEGDSAFAAALGVFGAQGSGPPLAKVAAIGGPSHGPKLLAGFKPGLAGLSSTGTGALAMPNQATDQTASLVVVGIAAASDQAAPLAQGDPSLIGDTGQTARLSAGQIGPAVSEAMPQDQGNHLSGIALDHAPANGELQFDLGLPQTMAPAGGEALPVAPSASETPITLSSPSTPEAGSPQALGAMVEDGSLATDLDRPVTAKGPAPAVRADGTLLQANTSEVSTANADEGLGMGVAQPEPQPNDLLTDLQIASTAPINEVIRAPISASAKPIRAQSPKVEPGAAQGSAAGDARRIIAAAEASEKPIATSDLATETATEPFTRALQSTTPERAPLQSHAAPAPLVPGQTVGQPAPPLPPVAGSVATPPAALSPAAEPPLVSFQADKIAREMGVQIARRVASGGDELIIRLDPAELGRINIRLSVNEQGQLRAIVAAEAPSVVEAIRSDISELSRALEQAGVRTDSQSFRFDKGANGDPNGQWQQRYQQPNSASRHGETSGLAMAEDETSYRPLATNGRINMMA